MPVISNSSSFVPVNGVTMIQYIGRCDSLSAVDLDSFDETSNEIKNRTFRQIVGT